MKAVDLFAGMGGFTEGARQAGIRVVWAANHWRAAVDCHAANHPETAHACQDLHQADFTEVPAHDILLASPSCQGHSRARGKDRPHHDAARATAWAVVSCAEVHRPELVVCENVPEWMDWVLWPAWCQAMAALGYTLAPHVVDAADYGVRQNRRRVIVIGTRSRHPFQLQQRTTRQRPFAPCIDWQAPRWRKIDKTLAPATLQRISHGRYMFGRKFLISYYGNTKTARSLFRPIGTITTKDRWAVIDGDRMRMLSVEECRAAMGFPASYQLPTSSTLGKHMLGNAVCPPMIAQILREVVSAATSMREAA